MSSLRRSRGPAYSPVTRSLLLASNPGKSGMPRASSLRPGEHLIGDPAGIHSLRLLAERSGLQAKLSAAMVRRGFDPVYDCGQVLIDLAVAQILGGEAISDFQGVRHLGPVIGPVPSTPTV